MQLITETPRSMTKKQRCLCLIVCQGILGRWLVQPMLALPKFVFAFIANSHNYRIRVNALPTQQYFKPRVKAGLQTKERKAGSLALFRLLQATGHLL